MDLDRLVDMTLAVQRVAAPTFAEGERGEMLFESFRTVDPVNIEMDVTGNVIVQASRGDSGPVVVTAHMDSVFPKEEIVPAQIRANRLTGPGVGDNAVALAALIELCRDLKETSLNRPVWLVANVAEEGLGNLQGMEHVVDRFGWSHLSQGIAGQEISFAREHQGRPCMDPCRTSLCRARVGPRFRSPARVADG
jgi:acetylornithine deacetylase/succinyl-diaminopimelate desuccinylase-like protein